MFLACHGFTEEQIADALAISRRTVSTHIEDLHEVLDVKKKEDLIRKAINLKWVNPAHLCFLGTDLEIPPHPSKGKAGGIKGVNPGRPPGENVMPVPMANRAVPCAVAALT